MTESSDHWAPFSFLHKLLVAATVFSNSLDNVMYVDSSSVCPCVTGFFHKYNAFKAHLDYVLQMVEFVFSFQVEYYCIIPIYHSLYIHLSVNTWVFSIIGICSADGSIVTSLKSWFQFFWVTQPSTSTGLPHISNQP